MAINITNQTAAAAFVNTPYQGLGKQILLEGAEAQFNLAALEPGHVAEIEKLIETYVALNKAWSGVHNPGCASVAVANPEFQKG